MRERGIKFIVLEDHRRGTAPAVLMKAPRYSHIMAESHIKQKVRETERLATTNPYEGTPPMI
jgi:hypothetical protein